MWNERGNKRENETFSLLNCLTLNEIILKKVSVSINDRLIERKDRGYFHNCKMFNKKNVFLHGLIYLII